MRELPAAIGAVPFGDGRRKPEDGPAGVGAPSNPWSEMPWPLPDQGLPAAPVVGGYWTRNNQIEIDIVGADREPIAKELLFVGSIKWLGKPFDEHDRAALLRHWAALTDQPLPLVAISRGGMACKGIDASYGPEDLILAWP